MNGFTVIGRASRSPKSQHLSIVVLDCEGRAVRDDKHSPHRTLCQNERVSFNAHHCGEELADFLDDFFFAVFYRDLASSREFWDNNFSQNYQLSKTDGATLS